MNPRTTGLLVLAAAALGGFVYFYEIQGSEIRKDAEQAAKRVFPGVVTTEVSWVELTTTDGKKARAERREGAWQIVEPLAAVGDSVNLDGIAAGLGDLESEQAIENPQAPAVYGIDAASRVVRFGASGKEYELRIGKATPIGTSTYAVSAIEPARILTVPTYRITSLDRSLDDLRDRRVANFDRSAIGEIDVRWPDGGVKLRRGDAGWRLVEPIESAADETTVDTLLSNLSYLRADSFLDDPGSEAETGLDRPAFDVTLRSGTTGGGDPSTFRVRFGKDENGAQLVQGAGPGLVRVASQRLGDFPRDVTSYRFKELTRYVATDAKAVEFRYEPTPGAEVFEESVVHDDAGWTGTPDPVDTGKMARLVAELARLRANHIVADEVDAATLEKLGLAPPRLRIRILGGAEAGAPAPELGVVEIGTGGDEGPVARRPGDPTVYRLAPTVKDWLPSTLENFRATFVRAPGDAAAAAPEGAAEAPASDAEPEALPTE